MMSDTQRAATDAAAAPLAIPSLPEAAAATERSSRNDLWLIVFVLVFLASPFVFMMYTVIGLIVVAATTVPMVYLLCKEETVVDRLTRTEDRFAPKEAAAVSEMPATTGMASAAPAANASDAASTSGDTAATATAEAEAKS